MAVVWVTHRKEGILRYEPRLAADLDNPQVHSVETVGGHGGVAGGLGQTLPLAEQFLQWNFIYYLQALRPML